METSFTSKSRAEGTGLINRSLEESPRARVITTWVKVGSIEIQFIYTDIQEVMGDPSLPSMSQEKAR